MIVDLGAYAFFLLAPFYGFLAVAGIAALRTPGGAGALVLRISAGLLTPLYLIILISLMAALVDNRFDLLFVAQNTNPATPLIYKIVGVWGNHEGSLILWQLILAAFLACMLRRPANMPERTHALAVLIMASLIGAFYAFSAALANPFAGNGSVPPGSGDLNVLLQDVGQIIHPPLLYLGYTAAGATFALATAILLDRQLDRPWADWLRPWALTSWTFLTAGIALGSYWAYYELGWGGWWFWDPVENLALLPWILGTALVHSLQVTRARRQLVGWSLLLAILTFLLVLLGTFIVRSGLLTSVHTFAADPSRGFFLLLVLLVASALGLGAYAYGTARGMPAQQVLALNRQGVLLLNNLLLLALFAAVMAGTLAPTLIEILGGETYVVREQFYVPTFVYPSLLLLMLMCLGTWTYWGRTGLSGLVLLGGSFAALLMVALVVILLTDLKLSAGFMFALGVWLLVSTAGAWAGQQTSGHGWALAHLGLALAVLGMSASTFLTQERIFEFREAGSHEYFGQILDIRSRIWVPGENYHSLATAIEVPGRGVRVAETRLYHPLAATLNPATSVEDRAFLAEQGQPSSESAIFRGIWSDLFVNVQDRAGGAPLVTVSRKVGITWIWAGAALMTLGGFLALVQRRGRRP